MKCRQIPPDVVIIIPRIKNYSTRMLPLLAPWSSFMSKEV